jgi:hypothetical protein
VRGDLGGEVGGMGRPGGRGVVGVAGDRQGERLDLGGVGGGR